RLSCFNGKILTNVSMMTSLGLEFSIFGENMTIAKIAIAIVIVIHFLFAFKEFSGRNEASFYKDFTIQLAENQDTVQIGRIVANAAIFNLLLGVGLVISLYVSGAQGLLLKEYLL